MSGAEQAQVLELVAVQVGRRDVRPQDRLVEDLGMESADLVAVVATLEERFAREVPEAELAGLRTVADLVALVAPDRQ